MKQNLTDLHLEKSQTIKKSDLQGPCLKKKQVKRFYDRQTKASLSLKMKSLGA